MRHQSLNRFRDLLVILTLVGVPAATALIVAAVRPAPSALISQSLPRTQAQLASAQPPETRQVPDVLTRPPRTPETDLDSPFVRVAEQVIPGVVSVEGFRLVTDADDTHREIFRRMFPRRGDGEGEGFEVPSTGSGFIIDETGYVLTNDHVIASSDRISVHLADGRTYDAYMLGSDPGTDVAVLRIQPELGDPDLPVLPLGDSDNMRAGDWAIAVGNPLGELEGSFTVGVISATGRNNLRIAGGGPTYQDFIQTDASINFGNSGGPLVNIRGEVIGINSAVNPTGQGLGFAIPINMAREVAAELVRSGTVRRGFLGIVPQELSAGMRQSWEIEETIAGVLVGSVQSDSPADEGGLEAGDVILEFNRVEVSDVPEFRRIVADAGVGTSVPILLLRDGKERNLSVILALRPDTPVPPSDLDLPAEEMWLGAQIQEITPDLVALFSLHRAEGVVLSRIDMGRPAAQSGLRVGDVVLEVNERRVEDLEDFRDALRRAVEREEPLVFQVQRGNQTLYIDVGVQG